MGRSVRNQELPGAYRRSGQRDNTSLNRESLPRKPSRYTTSSFNTASEFGPDHFNFDESETSGSRSRNISTLPSGGAYPRHTSGSSFASSQLPPEDGKRRTISMGAHLHHPSSRVSQPHGSTLSGHGFKKSQKPPPYTISDSTNRTRSGSEDHHRMGSDGSSVYSSADSFDSHDDLDRAYPPRPPKPKYLAGDSSSSNFTGQFYPNPMQSANMSRLQSGYSEDTTTTLTNGENPPTDIDELAEYFNKKLDDVQRQADSAINEMSSRRSRSQVNDSFPDGSMYSYSRGPQGGGSYARRNNDNKEKTIRPTNRANATTSVDNASTITPTNSRSYRQSEVSDMSISAVRDEITNLKKQLSRGLDNLGSRNGGNAREMDEMAEYFSKRLEECQKRVYSAVNKVQTKVGELKNEVPPPPVPREWHGDEEYYDSSDSGIGPRNLTIRPPNRAHGDSTVNRDQAPPMMMAREQQQQQQQQRHHHSNIMDDYPPPPDDEESFGRLESMMESEKVPPRQMDYDDEKHFPPIMDEEGEEEYFLGSDDEEDWDDFEDFIDDDTPAPETATRVPKIAFKKNNYIYQTVYVTYVLAFLAYVYVRINFTLDAPGLNRIYCIVVAILEIITAPSLILQGLCLWKWISREPHEEDSFERMKFHTARIMVPTYKEPLEVVAGTVHEIIHMDLPPHFHVHVYVLDDGKRENLENWVLSKRTKRRVYLHYVARVKLPGVPHHAKAGNINHTLHYIFDDAYADRECVIIFDADFMPRRNYLLRVLPVFSEKRTRPLALVQTPQFFYNVNPDEDVWDHLNVSFFHRIEPSLDRWSAVNCCGTNFVVRADALKDVGYFPVGCLTEDTLLSLRLCTMGWGVAYHHEILAIGQSPHEITEIFKQRSRWCKGNLQIFLDEFPLMQSGLSLSQRIFYSSCGFNYFAASISIPFFQLVPAWAIFFGLWPVSEIGLEFAFAFFIYYILGNILLLFPPPGFSIRDMWNGELASTNLWFTYFNGVRRIVGTKLLKGKGELTFKTTKKKTEEDEEGSNVGFQKEDVRACYMHFIMFFIMVVTIIYAIVNAVIAKNVKFYYYYMYMIGMSWALINMTPYLIVVIYCWYRVRIPGLLVACFRNVQLLLRFVCAALIMVQAFTTRNLTENFVCPHQYTGLLGRSPLAMVSTTDDLSGLQVMRNSFWLLGLKDDFYTIQQIKKTACEDDEIPIIVMFMHPSQGLALDAEAGHYMPDQRIDTWEEYDEKIDEYAEHLSEVPSLIVMEPSLLMHTFNSKTQYHNSDYQLKFADRVHKVTRAFPNSWIYVDAGNAMYLQWKVNLQHIIEVLTFMPKSIRGFSINVGSFVNVTFNEQLADEIHCQTGLHYLIDTSRNGGAFSLRNLDEINECTYDPPQVTNSSVPMWGGGSKDRKLALQDIGTGELPVESTPDPFSRKKRWVLGNPNTQYDPVFADDNPAAGGVAPAANAGGGGGGGGEGGGGAAYGDDSSYYDYTYGDAGADSNLCITTDQSGLDAYAWVKTPGESDGRLYPSGTYHPCLIDHFQECSETCPQYVPKIAGEFERPEACICGDIKR